MKIEVDCLTPFLGLANDHQVDTYQESESRVLELCRSTLTCEKVKIERVHRNENYTSGQKRPVIAKFSPFRDKQAVLANAKKQNGKEISISEDFFGKRAKEKEAAVGLCQS